VGQGWCHQRPPTRHELHQNLEYTLVIKIMHIEAMLSWIKASSSTVNDFIG